MTAGEAILGINIGNSYSTAALVRADGKLDVVCNDQGFRATPTVIAYGQAIAEVFVGDQAKAQRYTNIENTLVDLVAFLGKPFSDPAVQALAKTLPFQLVEGEGGKVAFQLEREASAEEEKQAPVSLTQIWTVILQKLKQDSEEFLGLSLPKAVLALPKQWTTATGSLEKVPEELLAAAKTAGFSVQEAISEPVAIAMSLGLDLPETPAQQALLVDVGGVSTSITALSVDQGILKTGKHVDVEGCSGHLMDEAMAKHFAPMFLKENPDVEPEEFQESVRAHVKLLQACETARRALSASSQTTLEADSLFEGLDLFTPVNRIRLRQIIAPVLKPLLEALQEFLDSGFFPDQVYILGGCGKMPTLRAAIGNTLAGVSRPIRLEDAAEVEHFQTAAAVGAALHAAEIALLTPEQRAQSLPLLRTSHTLSVRTGTGSDLPLVPAGTLLPLPATPFQIQGPGHFRLTTPSGVVLDVPVPAKATLTAEVSIDAQGVVSVSVGGGKTVSSQPAVEVQPEASPAAAGLSQEKIFRRRVELYISRILAVAQNPKANFSPERKDSILKEVAALQKWFADNAAADLAALTKELQAFEARIRSSISPPDLDSESDLDIDSDLDGDDSAPASPPPPPDVSAAAAAVAAADDDGDDSDLD